MSEMAGISREGISVAEYRRFISYMYLYENDRKSLNSGFVRVESRNGQCRIAMHLSGGGSSESARYQVYMLTRDAEDYIGIEVGESMLWQQMAEMELLMDSEHLADSEYDLDCITGMAMLGEDGSIYGTRWDDEPLETDKFVHKEQLSGKLVRFGNGNDRQENWPVNETHADENPLIPEEELVQTLDTAVIDRPQRPHIYEQLMTQLPQMFPFDDDRVVTCVRLELQDIGRMPMSCWAYGSNSFLLHGYYCYRHLILLKLDSEQYLMGVPGIWQHREQYMASMFGFREFRPVSRENHGSGAFGYWCVGLKE